MAAEVTRIPAANMRIIALSTFSDIAPHPTLPHEKAKPGTIPPMLRRCFTFVSALSLLLCLATASVWARSYFASDLVECQEPGDAPFDVRDVWCAKGRLCFARDTRAVRDNVEDSAAAVAEHRAWSYERRPAETYQPFTSSNSIWNRLGFWHEEGDAHGESWAAPFWPFAAGFGALPGLRLGRWIAAGGRRGMGRCRSCGYDLRATPDRCPECGTARTIMGATE